MSDEKKPRKESAWNKAMKEWTAAHKGSTFPKKGTEGYEQIKAIEARIKGEKAPAPTPAPSPAKKKGKTLGEAFEEFKEKRKMKKEKIPESPTIEIKEVKEEVKEEKKPSTRGRGRPKKMMVAIAAAAPKMEKSDIVIGREVPIAHVVPIHRIAGTDSELKIPFK